MYKGMNQTRISTSNVNLDTVALSLENVLDNVLTSKVVQNGDFGRVIELEFNTNEEPVDFVLLSDVLERYSVNIIQVAARREPAPVRDVVSFWLGTTPK